VRPMLEAAGYRVTDALEPGVAPDVVLTLDNDAAEADAVAPVVRLSSRRGSSHDGSIYRYDRDGLLSAVAAARRK
jgi:two-component system chemotaxis sensor kinase CheA